MSEQPTSQTRRKPARENRKRYVKRSQGRFSRLAAEDVEVVSLDLCGDDPFRHPVVVQAGEWIRGMTPELDDEEGPAFWEWILQHHAFRSENADPLYATFFLVEIETGAVVGTASVVNDDQGLSEKYDLPGPWIGGFNVHRDYSGQVGQTLYDVVHAHLQKNVDERGEDLRVNLFTTEDIARALTASDLNYVATLTLPEHDNQIVCYRVFTPQRR